MKAIRLLHVTVLAVLAGISTQAFSHGGGHPVRYVSPDGNDQGECASPNSPCRSLSYAVTMSSKGDQILMASGEYVLDELDVFYLLSDMVKIRGGYSSQDAYAHYAPQENLTTVIGIPAQYRSALAERGFRLLQDEKHIETGVAKQEKGWLATYRKLTTTASSSQACVNGMSGANPCANIDRVAHVPLSAFDAEPSSANDIWGFVDLNTGREYALVGLANGTSVWDVTAPEAPVEVGHVAGAQSGWRDIKVYQYHDANLGRYRAYAYVTTEGVQGLQILDLTELPERVSLATVRNDDLLTAHNVYLSNVDYATGEALEGLDAYLYVAGSNRDGGAYRVYNLDNPEAPTLVAVGAGGYIHDAASTVIRDERAAQCAHAEGHCEVLVDFNETTVDLWDMTDKTQPVLISQTSYPGVGYVHSGWVSEDTLTVFVQDELDERGSGLNTTLRAMSIQSLTEPQFVGTYTGPTRAIDHNGFTVGTTYYMSNYRRGLTVLDVADPANMEEIGYFDTFAVPADNTASFNGAWGVYPFLPSGNLLVSDIEYGLWVLKMNDGGTLPSPAPSPEPSPSSEPEPSVPADSGGSGGGAAGIGSLLLMIAVAYWRRRRH